MKAFLATCIAGAIAFSGVIYLVGGSTPRVTVPDVMPVAMPDVAANFAPAVPGRFPMSGFPDDRVALAEPSHQDAAPDAGAEKAAAPVLASFVTGANCRTSNSASQQSPGRYPSAVSAPSLTAVDTNVPTNCNCVLSMPPGQRRRRRISGISFVTSGPNCRLPRSPQRPSCVHFKDIPVGTPVEEIKRVSDAFGLDFNFMKAVAKIKSGFDPKQRTGSYIGLFQLSKYEFGKFGSGDILNPRDNAVAAAYKMITEGILFGWVTHRKPDLERSLSDSSTGLGRRRRTPQPTRSHRLKSMCATGEGREKGEKWCRRAIWGNMLPAVKESVEIG